MAKVEDLQEKYGKLERRYDLQGEEAIDASCLLAFDYEYPQQESEILIDSDEFTAVCPWTGLPDFGTLTLRYVPQKMLLELKSLKFYLLSYREVGIMQEHAANCILRDIVAVCQPRRMSLTLEYNVRGGIHTTVNLNYSEPES